MKVVIWVVLVEIVVQAVVVAEETATRTEESVGLIFVVSSLVAETAVAVSMTITLTIVVPEPPHHLHCLPLSQTVRILLHLLLFCCCFCSEAEVFFFFFFLKLSDSFSPIKPIDDSTTLHPGAIDHQPHMDYIGGSNPSP